MGQLLGFALIGLLVGGAARLFYPGRQPGQILATMALGVVGALGGGLVSWAFWPAAEGQFGYGNLLLPVGGAGLAVVFWAGLTYARRVS